jgi:hypothetical protein
MKGESRAAGSAGLEAMAARCLWNALKRQGFPILDLLGRAMRGSRGGEDGSGRNKCNSQD